MIRLANVQEEDIVVHTVSGDIVVKAGEEFECDDDSAVKAVTHLDCVRVKEVKVTKVKAKKKVKKK